MDDWERWEAQAKIPIYKPNGLQPGYIQMCSFINWYGLRSPIGMSFAECCVRCMGTQPVSLDDTETLKLMMHSIHPNCPPEYVGIYWLRDLTQHSSLITLHDADWKSNRLGYKSFRQNWVKANTCFGSLSTFTFLIGHQIGAKLKFEISPNRKWILFSYPVNCCGQIIDIGPKQWAYIFVNGGVIYTSNGETIQIQKGDMLRIDFEKWDDPNSNITYMYLVQRIYVDELDKCHSNKLKATQELERRINIEGTEPLCMSCNNSNNVIKPHLHPQQHIVRIAPQTIERI